MTETHPILTSEQETAAARAIEAGVLAAAALDEPPAGLDATSDELHRLVRLGEAAADMLLWSHGPLVRGVVSQEYRGVGSREDLFQDGWLAMTLALRRFDHRRGRFCTFALPAVRASVRRTVAVHQGRSERQSRGMRRVRSAEAALTQLLRRTPRPSDVASALGRDERWLDWCGATGSATPAEVFDEIAAVEPEPSLDLSGPRVAGDLHALVCRLPEPARTVVLGRFPLHDEVRSYDDLAQTLQVSTTTVRRLERRGLAALRRRLLNAGGAGLAA